MSVRCVWCRQEGHLGIHCRERPGGPKPVDVALARRDYESEEQCVTAQAIAKARAEGIAAGLRMAAEHARGCEEEADLRCAGARGPQGHYEHGATNMAANIAAWCEAKAEEVER